MAAQKARRPAAEIAPSPRVFDHSAQKINSKAKHKFSKSQPRFRRANLSALADMASSGCACEGEIIREVIDRYRTAKSRRAQLHYLYVLTLVRGALKAGRQAATSEITL